jgi:hypothetical protein
MLDWLIRHHPVHAHAIIPDIIGEAKTASASPATPARTASGQHSASMPNSTKQPKTTSSTASSPQPQTRSRHHEVIREGGKMRQNPSH